jgi:tricorn protease interacting factor F2/3
VSSDAPIPKVLHYRLHLDLHFDRLTFEGTVDIELEEVRGPVAIDALGLEVRSVRCGSRDLDWTPVPGGEGFTVFGLPEGPSTLTIDFAGKASDTALIGLYRSRFGTGYILTTQCAPTGARRLFPCIDRPDRKAPFRFSATVPEGLDVLFNTPVEASTSNDRGRTLTFTPTPPMPTYLFYLGVGRFEALKGPSGRVQIATYAPPGRGASGQFALDAAGLLLPAFERYFGIDYPLPKLDLIAVPQFAYGAMENWGAITFRDMYLLIDQGTATRIKRYGLDTIAHEIAHQWFGNLVTMEWWTDIWLNESFATFLEMRIVEKVYPDYGSLDNWIAYWMALGLNGDALPHTHPVTTEITDPNQIAQIFDEISYGKGSAILRMIEAYIGEAAFQRGVTDYLHRFTHGNARSLDLWESLERSGSEPIRPLLEAWTQRPGHPIITAAIEPGGLRLRQRRFSLSGAHKDETYPVPLTYEVNGQIRKQRFDGSEAFLPTEPIRSLHLNPGSVGFYRTLYDATGYDILLREFAGRPAADQWTLLYDLGAFLFSGDVSFELYAKFLAASETSNVHLTVRELADTLLELWLILGDHPATLPATRSFLRAQFDRLGPRRRPGEVETDGVLRERVTSAGVWADPMIAQELARSFQDPAGVDPDLRLAAATAYARAGGAPEHDQLRQRVERSEAEGEAADYEVALASFRDPSLVEATLDLLDQGVLNRANLPSIVRRAAWNPEGRAVTWRWITERLQSVGKESQGTGFASYVYEYSLPYVGLDRAEVAAQWVATHPVAEGDRGAKKGFGLLASTLALRQRFT